MRVVDDDERLAARRRVDLFHAAGDLGSILNRTDDLSEFNTQADGTDDRDRGVLDIDLAEDGHRDAVASARGIDEGEDGATDRLVRRHIADLPVGVVVSQRGHRRHRDRRLLGEATAPLIIDAYDGAAGVLRRKQQGLGLEVVLHVAVVVEVTPAPQPYSSVAARKRAMTGASAVVRTASNEIGPTCVSTVPHSEALGKRDAMAARIRYEVVVLPFVPVTAIVVKRVAGEA